MANRMSEDASTIAIWGCKPACSAHCSSVTAIVKQCTYASSRKSGSQDYPAFLVEDLILSATPSELSPDMGVRDDGALSRRGLCSKWADLIRKGRARWAELATLKIED